MKWVCRKGSLGEGKGLLHFAFFFFPRFTSSNYIVSRTEKGIVRRLLHTGKTFRFIQ